MADTRKDWFREAKYGLFMHWGLYSILAGEYKGVKTDSRKIRPSQSVKKVEVQEALLPLNRRGGLLP